MAGSGQAVVGTTHLDAVHRVIGKPGVIPVGEGNPNRTQGLLNQEKKKIRGSSAALPSTWSLVGNDEGQVELSKLEKHLNKLPKNIDGSRSTPRGPTDA